MSNYVHDCIKGVFGLLRVEVRGVVVRKFGGELLKLGYWYFSLHKCTSVFESSGYEHGDGGVKEGDAPTNFAGERVEI